MTLSGKKTVTTPGVNVPLGTQAVYAPLAVKALSTNTGLVFLGDAASASSAGGYPLLPGDQVVFDTVGSLASLCLDAAVSGEGVAWLVLSA